MAHKYIWGLHPETLVTKTGKKVLVGMQTLHDTGKKYSKELGAKDRARQAKAKANEDQQR